MAQVAHEKKNGLLREAEKYMKRKKYAPPLGSSSRFRQSWPCLVGTVHTPRDAVSLEVSVARQARSGNDGSFPF